jgi:hypothetical protein
LTAGEIVRTTSLMMNREAAGEKTRRGNVTDARARVPDCFLEEMAAKWLRVPDTRRGHLSEMNVTV